MSRRLAASGVALLLLCFAVPARADLVTYADFPGLVYDSTQNLTWLQDANYARTSGYAPPDGVMDWYQATAWAESLVIVSGGVTFDRWRLPGTPGLKWRGIEGEWGNLNLLYGITTATPGPFINLMAQDYWTKDPYLPARDWYWYYTFDPAYLGQYATNGSQTSWDPKAMAVFEGAPGEPGGPVVPEPATLVLLGSGLVGLRGWRKRRE